VPSHLICTTARIKAKGDPLVQQHILGAPRQLDKLLGGRVAHKYVPCDAGDQNQSVVVQGDGESWDAIGTRFVPENELGDLALCCRLEANASHVWLPLRLGTILANLYLYK